MQHLHHGRQRHDQHLQHQSYHHYDHGHQEQNHSYTQGQSYQPQHYSVHDDRNTTRHQITEKNDQSDRDESRGRIRTDQQITRQGQRSAHRPSSHSNSQTPRIKGNPQSPQNLLPYNSNRNQADHNAQHQQHSSNSGGNSIKFTQSTDSQPSNFPQSISTNRNNNINSSHSFPQTPLTPLATLSTILTTAHHYHQTTKTSFRTSHTLALQARERTQRAQEALRQAQAEYEHAKTAEEYALSELERAKKEKEEMHEHVDYVEGQVRSFSRKMRDRRVELKGLKRNEGWNGRRGKIVKLVMDGEDLGRWKIKIETDGVDHGKISTNGGGGSGNRRGGDPDGVDGRDSLNGEIHNGDTAYPDGDGGQNNNRVSDGAQNQMQRRQEQQHIVAKAENLILLDGQAVDETHDIFGSMLPMSGLQPRTKSNLSSKSKDPDEDFVNTTQLRHNNRGISTITPEKDENNMNFHRHHHKGSQHNDGHDNYNNPPGHYDSVRSRRQSEYDPTLYLQSNEQNHIHHSRLNAPQSTHSNSHQDHHPQRQQNNVQQRQPNYTSQSQKTQLSDRSQHSFKSKARSLISPPPTLLRRESITLSTAFSNMLLSPVTFEPVSFTPSVTTDGEGDHHKGGDSQTGDSRNLTGDVSVAGSFFEEVTSRQYPNESRAGQSNDRSNVNAGHHNICDASEVKPPFKDNPNMTPSLVFLTDNDEQTITSFPPPCVGIKDAGVPYVNGVYLLTNSNSNSENHRSETEPPVYFKDGPPVLLSNNRYYDMCILRIPCPDSPDHVIWFLARVDIDPDCEDVKFSDCYYYCRLLRVEGVENDIPPEGGWKIPSVPPGVRLKSRNANEFDNYHHDGNCNDIGEEYHDREDHAYIYTRDHGNLGIQPMNADGFPRDSMFSPGLESEFSTFSA